MKIAVVGATSRTGLHLVRHAIARGHEVTAFTRRPDVLGGLRVARVVHGEGTSADDLRAAVRGQDAVISIVAASERRPTRVASDVTRALVRAMKAESVGRLVVTSSRSISSTARGLFVAIVWWVFRFAYVDLVREETIVEESGLDYTIVRGTRLTDARGTGRYHVDDQADATGGTHALSREDFALAILDAAEERTFLHKAIGVNGPDRTTPARARARGAV